MELLRVQHPIGKYYISICGLLVIESKDISDSTATGSKVVLAFSSSSPSVTVPVAPPSLTHGALPPPPPPPPPQPLPPARTETKSMVATPQQPAARPPQRKPTAAAVSLREPRTPAAVDPEAKRGYMSRDDIPM